MNAYAEPQTYYMCTARFMREYTNQDAAWVAACIHNGSVITCQNGQWIYWVMSMDGPKHVM